MPEYPSFHSDYPIRRSRTGNHFMADANPPTGTARHYCFTLNNPPEDAQETFFSPELPELVRYVIWQYERGSSGTLHIQGYLELHKPSRYAGLIKALPQLSGAHFEKRRGTRAEARKYCQKADSRIAGPWEVGVWEEVAQGKRTDLDEACELIKGGATERDIADSYPSLYVKFYRGFQQLKRKLREPIVSRDPNAGVNVILYLGPSGCGKTRTAEQHANRVATDPGLVYWKSVGKWWDGYDGRPVVIFDDFCGSCPYRDYKIWFDRYPCSVEFKGGVEPLVATTFFLTTCVTPDLWYNRDTVREFNLKELTRRLTEINAYDKHTDSFICYKTEGEQDAYQKYYLNHPDQPYP